MKMVAPKIKWDGSQLLFNCTIIKCDSQFSLLYQLLQYFHSFNHLINIFQWGVHLTFYQFFYVLLSYMPALWTGKLQIHFFHIMLIPSTQGHFKKMPPGDSNLLSDSHLI